MADGAIPRAASAAARPPRGNWMLRLVADPAFQAWAARTPLIRRIVRREGAEMFALVSGFVQSQALLALIELEVLPSLADGPRAPDDLAGTCGLAPDRMALLLQAGAALGLLRRHRDGRFALARRGAALLGVPGLAAMIDHHRVFYRDLADPVALLRGETDTELARFWPYVFGAGAAEDPAAARRYSDLMADSQGLVAEETLAQVDFAGVRHLLDVGGGSGAFAAAVAQAYPDMALTLFDLPQVVPQAVPRLERLGMADRVRLAAGSFRCDPLPDGADAISLIRVLYDHADDTVSALLTKVFAALPPGGRLIVSEPMGGGARPCFSGDVYFAFYTLAMGTGKARSAAEIATLLKAAGFSGLRCPAPRRAFVTRIVTATRPA